MTRPDSKTLRRRYGFLSAKKIEKQLKKVEEQISWIRTEGKWSVGFDLALGELDSLPRVCASAAGANRQPAPQNGPPMLSSRAIRLSVVIKSSLPTEVAKSRGRFDQLEGFLVYTPWVVGRFEKKIFFALRG